MSTASFSSPAAASRVDVLGPGALRIAILNAPDVVAAGLPAILEPFGSRVVVVPCPPLNPEGRKRQRQGSDGYVSLLLSASDFVDALEIAHLGLSRSR